MSRTIKKRSCLPTLHGGVNFQIIFSLLELYEISRSAQTSMFPSGHLHGSMGGMDRVNLENKLLQIP